MLLLNEYVCVYVFVYVIFSERKLKEVIESDFIWLYYEGKEKDKLYFFTICI